MRVLIIEDDSLFAEILETFLGEKECQTIISKDLLSAKSELLLSPFDFVLLDNHLPDGDGINFLHFIKELPYKVPVMMVTAEDDQSVMSNAFDKGADDFLIKPFSVNLLWQKIQRNRELYDKEDEIIRKTIRLEKLINQQEQEEKLARYVYEHVASLEETETECVDTYIQSSSSFNGDVFICDTAPNGNRFMILADATGHGLAAAISVLPLVATIRAMIRKGLTLAHIVHEANKKLNKELPDDKFVALIGVEVNFNKQRLQLFNGGMPDVISLRTDKSLELHSSTSMALGILDPEDFDPAIVTLETGPIRNLFFYSDGLIEQPNPSGEVFGMSRLLALFKRYDYQDSLVAEIIREFTEFNDSGELLDDLSMCDLQVEALMEKHLNEKKKVVRINEGKITATLEIEGPLIASTDIVGCLDSIMRSADMVGDLRQRAFTVFSELISNGLDHGILDLDSKLKTEVDGFAEYFQLKEERLENIGKEEKLSMKFAYSPETSEIDFEIVDSGKGFDLNKAKDTDDNALSGRGRDLINKLCKSVDIVAPGNKTIVNMKRDS
ncbi:SpoIIE family protein phosphatase [Glaciecola sp. MF2-115]|uniref:SpoIIE family protein phosphatase n=1 Tax=Glaciecola sp. MF2-115 TaxID=3384827 RepID=UPI0039A3D8AD